MKLAFLVIALVSLVGFLLFWPIKRAANAYTVAEANYDRAGICRHANEAADAWAGLGFAGKSKEWRKKGEVNCAMDALERSLGG